MKLLTLLGAGLLAVGTTVGIAEPASAQYYGHGYHRAHGHYRHGYDGYRHRPYGYGWHHGYRWHPHHRFYARHRYYR